MKIIELARWDYCGQGEVEQSLNVIVGVGKIQEFSGYVIQNILQRKGLDITCGYPDNKYYVYYNYHHSSGHRTEFRWEDDQTKFDVIEPSGGVFPAFWSEVVILELVQK